MDDAQLAPPDWEEAEGRPLAPYAMRTSASRGRRHAEDPHPYRSLYERDRDRIIHSTAFRRLMHKTQVLVSEASDHHRTRLTHTLEVAQISRTIARQLGLNEDLTEAIALAHDLGHPPFGHAGEDALAACMSDHGGFEHNLHGLRILEKLENRYPDYPGLNLSWEVLQAQALHSKVRESAEIQPYLEDGRPLLEAQVVDAADSLAYDTHDVDDALNVGVISLQDLATVEFWKQAEQRVRAVHSRTGLEPFQPTMVRALIDWQVSDLLENTRRKLREENTRSVEDVRGSSGPLVAPGHLVLDLKGKLERFLHANVYRHHRVMRMAAKGRQIVTRLFETFRTAPGLMPDRYFLHAQEEGVERAVCDYLAGMTDRFAQQEYLRLFHPDTPV